MHTFSRANRARCFINPPSYVSPDVYESAINRVVELLQEEDGIVAIYQVGYVSTPGISDIDLVIVFEDGVSCSINPLEHLPKQEKYLFTHSVFGTSRRFFHEALRYTFYHNYHLRWGKELTARENNLPTGEVKRLKYQIALEFLLANYISKTVERTYGVVSLRNLLLSVNGLRYDLEFLNISTGSFYELVHQFIAWRNRWFEEPVPRERLTSWFEAFYKELEVFLVSLLEDQKLYLPAWANLQYGRHIRLQADHTLGYMHKGLVLPTFLGALGKRFIRAQHRYNRFQFFIPLTHADEGEMLENRFVFLSEMKGYNAAHLKSFSILASNWSNVIPPRLASSAM